MLATEQRGCRPCTSLLPGLTQILLRRRWQRRQRPRRPLRPPSLLVPGRAAPPGARAWCVPLDPDLFPCRREGSAGVAVKLQPQHGMSVTCSVRLTPFPALARPRAWSLVRRVGRNCLHQSTRCWLSSCIWHLHTAWPATGWAGQLEQAAASRAQSTPWPGRFVAGLQVESSN